MVLLFIRFDQCVVCVNMQYCMTVGRISHSVNGSFPPYLSFHFRISLVLSGRFNRELMLKCSLHLLTLRVPSRGRDSSVDIATRYGLDGPGIESRWGRDFPYPSTPALGPTQPLIQWVLGLPRE